MYPPKTSLVIIVLLVISACSAPMALSIQTGVTATPWPSKTPFIVPSALPERTPTPVDSGWVNLSDGLERRQIHIAGPDGTRVETLFILRIDPAYHRFDVGYNPDQPRMLQNWQIESGALVVVNGGYYALVDERYPATGLVVSGGQIHGASYGSFAGMLAIGPSGPELRWLSQQPYDPAEPLSAALQSFPILVKPGGFLGFSAEHEDYIAARRTAIAQDKSGRILFILAPTGYFTLHQFSLYLTKSDLALDIAVNLDGGPSTGLLLAEPFEQIQAYSALPLVILVFRK